MRGWRAEQVTGEGGGAVGQAGPHLRERVGQGVMIPAESPRAGGRSGGGHLFQLLTELSQVEQPGLPA